MKIYLDNAATTPLDPAVFEAMTPYLLNHFGNPSSHHQAGREAKAAIENARKTIANLLGALPEEIIFTSGGTEADNIAIHSAVYASGVKNVITNRFEHHAVLHTLEELQRKGDIDLHYIEHDAHGMLDLAHLEHLLQNLPQCLVSVMHANNEVGNLNDIVHIADVCSRYHALFHTDTVQTMGHYWFDLHMVPIHFITGSAHKFHGPKGVGFLYRRKGQPLSRLIHGGGQEKQLRAGTENLHGIVGMARALELAYAGLDAHHNHIQQLKNRFIDKLKEVLPDIRFNGTSADSDKSLYTVLSISLPGVGFDLLHYLDAEGIAVSGGSACSTGSASHVLQALGHDPRRTTIRFSFSRFNTGNEIDEVIEKLAAVYKLVAA